MFQLARVLLRFTATRVQNEQKRKNLNLKCFPKFSYNITFECFYMQNRKSSQTTGTP